jgi:hypothetical protein
MHRSLELGVSFKFGVHTRRRGFHTFRHTFDGNSYELVSTGHRSSAEQKSADELIAQNS